MKIAENTHIQRSYDIQNIAQPGRVLVVYGPRRAGKTTLIQDFLSTYIGSVRVDSGDYVLVRELLGSGDAERILAHVAGKSLYVVDEAQHVPNIGTALKIIVDARPDMYVIATGSSSFDLANKIGEPLVGRQEVITLYPLSLAEVFRVQNNAMHEVVLNESLIYGMYPQVVSAATVFEKETQLKALISGYLLKDIFELADIEAPSQLLHLVTLLAQYIGQPVSAHKLANEVGLHLRTVERYLDLLEKTFVIQKLMPFSHKLSQSLKFKPKYYFYDVGIRNALIGNFLPPHQRADIGALWENFCVIERMKRNAYARESHPNYFFYQSYHTKKEIDLIEQYNGHAAYECKWTSDVKTVALPEWDAVYPNSITKVVSKETYREFLL